MSIEPLVFRILADADDRGVKAMDRAVGNLDISGKKASTTIRSFVAELAQARSGADVASAALGAFSKVLGTTLAGTAVVMAGKVIIDAFQKVSENVGKAKESLSAAREEIAKMGSVKGLAEGAAQANLLYKAASDAERSIKEIEKSKLTNFIAEIRGAKDELKAMAEEASRAANEVKRSGIEQESAQREIQKNLTKGQAAARKTAEEYSKSIEAAMQLQAEAEKRVAEEMRAGVVGPTQATEDLRRAQQLTAGLRSEQQRAAAEAERQARLSDIPSLEERLSGAEAAGASAARGLVGMAELEREAMRRGEARAREIGATSKKGISAGEAIEDKKLEIAKEINRLEMDASELRMGILDLEKQNIDAKRRVIETEGAVARELATGGGTGRGAGQMPSSFEIGAQRKAEKAAQDESYRLRNIERERIRNELKAREMQRRFEAGERPGQMPKISGYDIDREISRKMDDAAKAERGDVYNDAKNARAGAQATEETLRAVKDNLMRVLDELKTYAHAT